MKIRLPHWTLVVAVALATMVGCSSTVGHNLPPAERLMEPGPGVGGPGPGVIPPVPLAGMPTAAMAMPGGSVQVLFAAPESLQVAYDVGGLGQFDSVPLISPGRLSFPEGGLYRLKLTNIPGREGLELYPTLEVAAITPRTDAFLQHNALPVQFTPEDFDQVAAGNFVTKVIYLPDPEFQLAAVAGVETLVSTRLDPGVDPIVEADRRGSIMGVVRVGNKDLALPDAMGAGGGIVGAPGYCMDGSTGSFGGGGVTGIPPQFVAGVSAPMYGMPISGTPIGLPGPPHIPLGAPAGLQKHVMHNHTYRHIPGPNPNFVVHVKQKPGYTYPDPPSRMMIRENSFHPNLPYHQVHPYRAETVGGLQPLQHQRR